MGRREFLSELASRPRLAMDTCCVIYYLGEVEGRYELSRAALASAIEGRSEVQLSGLTQMELLVRPFQDRNVTARRKVMTLLEGTSGIRVTPVNRAVLMTAAEVRARTRMKTPDAIIAASAVVHGCDAIVGNDAEFRRLSQVDPASWTMFDGLQRPLPTYLHLDDFVD